MMKVLVIGGNGLLGTELNYRLSNAGFNVISSSRGSTNFIDLLSLTSIRERLEADRPGLVINLAAMTNVDDCEKDPEAAFLQNAKTCENLHSVFSGKTKIIHISTDHFYNSEGLSSEDELSPLNYYAYSKLLGEKMLNDGAVILRTNFFGKSKTTKKSFTDWIFDELTAKKEIKLFQDSFFSPLSMGSLSDGIIHVCRNFIPGTYNLGSNKGMSKLEFGVTFAKACDLNTDLIKRSKMSDADLTAKRPSDMRMNVEKFEKIFNYKLPDLENLINSEALTYKRGIL